MKKSLVTLLAITSLTTGCMTSSVEKLTYETPQQLELATGAQDAVFHVAFGWTGGPAGAPVIDLESGRPLEMNGNAIYLDDVAEEATEKMMEDKNEFGSNIVKVSANITLVPHSSGEIMLPPTEEGGEPVFESRGFAALQINTLYDLLAVDRFGRKPKE